MTSTADSKFVLIEFSSEVMNVVKLYENITVGQSEYKLRGMVRSHNRHFTCAVLTEGRWTYIDDLCLSVKEFSNLAALKKHFAQGWFFTIYELSNTFCDATDSSAYNSPMGSESQEELKLDLCKITPSAIVKTGHFMNSVLSTPRTYSCAVESFLEVASILFLPHLSNLTVRNEFTELLFNTCSRYIKSRENSKLLEEIRESLWAYLRQQCPSFLARDSNACFSQIFEEKTFGKPTPDEMNLFSSLRTFQSLCETCQKDVVLNSSILANYVTRSALQNCELSCNSWPQFVSAIQTQPGKLTCPDCGTSTCEPVLTSTADSKFVLIEFSPELMNVVKLYENITVGQSEYKLRGMVRSHNRHFTCAVLTEGKWTYIDDLCLDVKKFSNLAALKKHFAQGWFS